MNTQYEAEQLVREWFVSTGVVVTSTRGNADAAVEIEALSGAIAAALTEVSKPTEKRYRAALLEIIRLGQYRDEMGEVHPEDPDSCAYNCGLQRDRPDDKRHFEGCPVSIAREALEGID